MPRPSQTPASPGAGAFDVWDEPAWRHRAAEHAARVDALTATHVERRSAQKAHPVEDFLWTYYSHRPSALRRWDPGYGVELRGDVREFAHRSGYVVDGDSARVIAPEGRRLRTVRQIRSLVAAIDRRPPQVSCFGLHEWAMVYRIDPDDLRHATWPLRLGFRGTDQVVESHRVRCSHVDAFRFFTEPARPLNAMQPTRERQVELDQPGCLHVSMDTYKWAYKLSPLVPSELVADAFCLARDAREVDMRASPYDLTELGYRPIAIETPQGKREYADHQHEFAARAGVLRAAIVDVCDRSLAASA